MGDMRHETLLNNIHQHNQNKCDCFNIFFFTAKETKIAIAGSFSFVPKDD
jgi:hypothetical protein